MAAKKTRIAEKRSVDLLGRNHGVGSLRREPNLIALDDADAREETFSMTVARGLGVLGAGSLVAIAGCTAVLGDFTVDDTNTRDAGDDASRSADSGHDRDASERADSAHDASEHRDSGHDDASKRADSGDEEDGSQATDSSKDGPTNDARPADAKEDSAPTCAPETASEGAGIFVSSAGTTVSCGTIAAPCGTITAGVTAAAAQSKSFVYVAAGNYVEQVTLQQSGLSIVGGWSVTGSVWTHTCDASVTVVAAPSTDNMTLVISGGGAPTLQSLTLKSKAQANPGESLYGVFVTGAATKATLVDVDVVVAAGGAGAAGDDGTSPAGPTSTCATAGTGAPGAPSMPGTPAIAGTFTASGYVPAICTDGTAGSAGQNGTLTAPDSHSCINAGKMCTVINTGISVCSYISSTVQSGAVGAAGCGGVAGGLGSGGGGGGSSIGVFSAGASVTITDGSVESDNGGAGGKGGAAGMGSSGSAGSTGGTYFNCGECGFNTADDCVQTTVSLLGGMGGPGGIGSNGGVGGGGAGGFSYALYAQGAATFDVSSGTMLTPGMAGTGGAGAGTGAPGKAGAQGP
jgi:hypothetical protein